MYVSGSSTSGLLTEYATRPVKLGSMVSGAAAMGVITVPLIMAGPV
jgi:hypothetical protein